jgi:hypothetical protein
VRLKEDEVFAAFRNDLLRALGVAPGRSEISAENVADFLKTLNRFFYQEHAKDDEKHISEFHKFWELNHEEILGFHIQDDQCAKMAQVLEKIFSAKPFKVDADVTGLSHELIANARYFTIIQDFKIRIKSPYDLARTAPELFNARSILANSPNFANRLLDYLGAKSQTDKRQKFSKLCAELLVKYYNGSAYNIAPKHENDSQKIIENLVSNPDENFKGQLGFSAKKAIILIRDMMDLGVWKIRNPEALDLPSDSNTMKVALRTGILRLRIPLLASYLDVYCSQYSSTDKWCRKDWRTVWDKWGDIPNNHRVNSPSSFDFLIYRAGQNWNKPEKMPEVRHFKEICRSETSKLNPPKSISIYGATGWESGRTNEGGGGGIMS